MSANNRSSTTRRSWLWMALAAILVGTLAVAAACGDDDDGGGGDGGGSPTATQAPDSGDDAGGDGDDGAEGDASQALSELASNYETFEGYVKYQVSGGAGLGLTTMAIYSEGDNSRFDIESEDGNIILIGTAEGTFFCSEDQCIKYPISDDTATSFAEAFTVLVDPGTVERDFVEVPNADYEVSSATIAGLDATCFTAGGEEAGGVCFSNDGALLLRISSSSDEGNYTLEAVEASTDVPSGSFDPPYDVIDFGDFGDLGDLFGD